jgi:amino acid adenylation domain-containing protein
MLKPDSDTHSIEDHGLPTMIAILRNKALHQGNRLAYTFLADGEEEKIDLTYGDLDRWSRMIGASLQLAGAAGERVLLLYPHGLEFIAAFLGCLYAGAIAVPAYPPRLNRSQLRLQNIIDDTQAAVALTSEAVLARVRRVFSETLHTKNLKWLATDEIASGLEEKWREPAINGDTLAMIQYTSGSTSAPKGVMVSHNNLLDNQRMIRKAFRQTEESIIVGWLPLYHDMGLIGNVLQPLFLGARCVLMSPTAFLQKPSRWLRAISDYRATTSGGPNFAYELCARKITPDERARLDLSCWTTAFNGAEPIFHETMERFTATFATCGFRREAFYPCYGLAEATLLVSAGRNSAQPDIDKEIVEHNRLMSSPGDVRNRIIVSCGQALPSERVVIVDPESSTQCPDGRVGEIWVSGPNVARGYWNRELETEQTFGAYLEGTEEGPFLRTGDLGYIKNGELFVAGRIKDLIIVRGRNYHPQDIELTVQQSDPALEAGGCAVFSIEVANEERLVIVKELSQNVEDPNSLIESIREAVAREHEVRAHAIALINRGSIPKTTSGKIQRYECRNQYQSGKLATIAEWRERLTPGVEPVNSAPAKKLLATDAIAAETVQNSLLSFLTAKQGSGVERVSVDKPLISYGFDSLTAIELSHHLELRFGVVLPAMSLLEDATISQLARQAVGQMKGTSCYSRPTFAQAPKGVTEHPLSYGQRSLWFLYQLAPLSGAYNVSSVVRIRSALSLEALRRALQKIVDRHDSLRTTFLSEGGEPFHRVCERAEVSLRVMDVSSWSDEFLDDYLTEEVQRPFNLEQGPLMKVMLFSRSRLDHFLLVVVHHIVVDLWSLGVLIHELGLFYRAELDSTEASLDPLPVRYADYVYWQRGLLAGREGERLWSYWQGQLAGDLGTLDLPTDRPRPPFQSFRGASQPICLSPDLTQALRSLGQNHRATLYITLQAIFHTLLHRYTGQEDILVGTPMAGRSAAELSMLMGYFVNLVVLRADLSGDQTFSAFLNRVRETTLAAFAHQDFPFALLVERLQPAHDPSRSPLFQVEFALQKAPALGKEVLASQALIEGAQMNFGGLSAESIVLRRRPSRFDLSLFVVEVEEGLKGFIEYNADLFDEWRIRQMADHFRRLAEAVAANPERRIHELEMMSAEEREQVIVEFNRTEREYGRERRVHELIEAQVGSAPDAIALIYEDQQLTYAELNTRANQLAHYLRGLGVGPEVVVGLCLDRSVEMVVAVLGVLKAGGAYLPLDPEHPIERLGYMLEDAGAGVVLTERKFEERLPVFWGQTLCLDVEWERISEEGDSEPGTTVEAENLAYMIYTSGSTGRPKGVMINHGGLVNYLRWATEAYRIEEGEGAPVQSSISFDLTVTSLYGPLVNGKKVDLLSEKEGIETLATNLSREGGYSLVKITPAHLDLLAQQMSDSELEGRTRALVIGGEALKADSLKYWRERARGTRLINEYGPTEAVVGCCVYEMNEVGSESLTVPIGKPIANTQIYLLDLGYEPAPVGVRGEIYISGDGLARGYVGSPELTGGKFIPNRFSRRHGERLYRTGDIGRRLPDGNIEYIGRADDQVKLRGYRIELGEIEAVLNEHRSIRQSAVMVNEDAKGRKRLIGYVAGEKAATPAELKRHLRERLPEHMIPEMIIAIGEMPLTANGKVDRKRLPPVTDAGRQVEQEYVGARTPIEGLLAGIFEDVLKLERVGRNDNFFEIGGHSLLATQAVSRIRNVLGVEIDVRNIFEDATVGGLARRIEEAIGAGERNGAAPAIRRRIEGQSGGQKVVRLPLSFAQQRLWFIDQLEPGKALYNIPGVVRLEGRLDLESLKSAIDEIVRRHEVLRTRIEVEDGEPMQVIDQWKPRRLEVEDLTAFPREEQEKEAGRMAREEAHTGFDLSIDPLMRVKVLKLGEDEHMLLFTMHHIVSDAWSTEILIREVGALYHAYSAGEPSPLSELPIQYSDFAAWQREWLKGDALEAELEYWRKQLSGMEDLELPTDYSRPAVRTYRGARHHFVIDGELTRKLRALSQREGVTPFMALLGGFDVLLSRYSGQEEIVIGTDIANRNRAEIEELIGFFVNQLVLRVEVRARESFGEFLKQVREVCLGAYAHQEAPFEKLVEELQPERDPSRSPLFQAKLIWQNAPREGLELGGVRLASIGGIELETSKLDLTVSITDEGRHLVGSASYSADLFEAETIERLVSHYMNVLRGAIEDGGKSISELDLLSDRERAQITFEWNETRRPYPNERYIHELFRERAERTSEQIALICNGQSVSYGELNRRANQVGHYLQRLGVGADVMVGLCLERSVEMVIALLGTLKAGGAYLPLDPASPLERLSYMLEDAGVGVALTERKLGGRLPAFWGQTVLMDEEWERISQESGSDLESRVVAENLAYTIYTSGSTGKPKGVMVRHRSLVNYTRDICRQLSLGGDGDGAHFATVSTITADLGNTCIYPSLVSGGCLHVLSHEEATDGARFAEYLRLRPIDALKIVPSHLIALMSSQPNEVRMLPRKYLILGGEALSPDLVARILGRGEGCELINHYGPTETTIGSLTARVSETKGKWLNRATAPIGRPIANTEVYVLDRELKPAPVGARGDLYIAGEGVARGYLGRPEFTAERFIPNPLSLEGGARFYRTGDVARYLSDGMIEFIGRADDQVKVRGYRIELGEIQAALNEHRSVRQSVVVVSEDHRGDKRLIGYVVSAEGEIVTAAELKKHVRERLPEYMAPEAILLLEELPLTANGKIDRKRLPLMGEGGRRPEREYASARTPVQEIVAGVFEEVLKIDRVGIHDNFFDIGGHSLLATQVVSRIRNTFGVEIGVGSVFEDGTGEGLARRIEEAIRAGEEDEAPPLVRIEREGRQGGRRDARLPLSFAQQRLWFLDQLIPNDPFYNCPRALKLEGRLDLDALERSVNEIVRRHEALRTRIEIEDGAPVQVIDEWEWRRLEVEVLTNPTLEEREAEASRVAIEEARTGFDLSRGPLLRVKLLKLDEELHMVLLTTHHIVSDGWSMGILIREVGALYRAYNAGNPSPLPELPIQYADFAVWQRNFLQGEMLERQLDYWRKQLAGLEPLELPFDYPRPAIPRYRGSSLSLELSEELGGGLRALSRREGVTLFMMALAAFQTLLMRYSRQKNIAVGAPIANRTRVEIEELIGFFVNTLVLRTEVEGKLSFRELLGQVREVTLDAYVHQDMPFEKLVEELHPDRSLNVQPLFQVMFVLHNATSQSLELPGISMETVNVHNGTSKFDILLTYREESERPAAVIEYNTDIFREATIERMLRHFKTLLEGILADPDRPISDLPILSEAERRQQLVEWNQTQAAKPAQRHIVEMFERQVEQNPDAIAVSFYGESLTYEQLNRSANQLAHYLRRLGVGPETPVGICLERSIQMMTCVMGTLKAAAAYVPIDPTLPRQRIAYVLEDSQVKLVLTQQSLLEVLEQQPVRRVSLDDCWPEINLNDQDNLPYDRRADHLVYLTYTSGSTGKPKGIAMTVRPLVNLLGWMLGTTDLSTGARTVQFASLGFDVSFQDIFSTWLSGGTLVLLSEAERQEIGQLWKALNERDVERIYIPSVALQQLAEGYNRQPEIKTPLRRVIAGSEQLQITQAVGRMFREVKHLRLYNEYGPSEAHVVTALELEQEVEKWEPRPCVGRPIWNTQIYIVDERMEPVIIGAPGELYIGGDGVARGYWRKPELTAERFVPDPHGLSPGSRLYRTGDVARYREDGKIDFLGRKDNQVKIRGYRVELGEIESELSQHPGVKEVVVTVWDRAGAGKRLVAYLVVEKDKEVSTSELRSYLSERVPAYMLPSSYVMLEEMPLTGNGKVDRGKLPEPEPLRPELEQKYEAPETATHQVIAGIWEEVLGIERVGIKDNFFELGGHSLLAAQVVSRVRDAFQVEIALRSLFESPTVEGLIEKMIQHEPQSGSLEEIARIWQKVECLSDDETKEILDQELLIAEEEG